MWLLSLLQNPQPLAANLPMVPQKHNQQMTVTDKLLIAVPVTTDYQPTRGTQY